MIALEKSRHAISDFGQLDVHLEIRVRDLAGGWAADLRIDADQK